MSNNLLWKWNFPLAFQWNQAHTLRMPNKDNLFMIPHVNKMHKALEDDNVGPTSKWHYSFLFFFSSFWQFIKHRHKLAHVPSSSVGKKPNFSSKQKGNKLKFRTSNRGPAYPVFREAGGRREGGRNGGEGGDGGRGGKSGGGGVRGWQRSTLAE